MSADRPSASALQSRDFLILWIGGGAASIGAWMHTLTVPFVLYELTGSAAWIGVATFSGFVPSLLITPLGGLLADRISRRRLLVAANLASAAVSGLLALQWLAGGRHPLPILALGVCITWLSLGSVSAWHAHIADVVPPEALGSAVSLNSAQVSLGRAVGPAVGGLVLATLGPAWTFGLNALSYLGTTAAVLVVKAARTPPVGRRSTLRAELAEARRVVWHDAPMRGVLFLLVAVLLCSSSMQQLVAPLVRSVLDQGAGWIGVLTGVLGLGSLAAAVYTSRVTSHRPWLTRACVAMLGGAMCLVGALPALPTAVIAYLVFGVAYMLLVAPLVVVFQTRSGPDMRGRTMSLFLVAFTTATAAGTLGQSLLSDLVGLRTVFVSAGVVLVSVAATRLVTLPHAAGDEWEDG